jgi:hypothetical protein
VTAVAHEADGPLSDEAALKMERETDSAALAVLTWLGPSRLEARVRLHLRDGDRWIERGLSFAPSDDMRERGRTVGFTLASMLPEQRPVVRRAQAPPAAAPFVVSSPAPLSSKPARFAVDALVIGSLGVRGNADGLGGAFALRRAVVPWLALRAELAGRTGVVQNAEATSLFFHGGLGVCLSPFGNAPSRRADLAARIDVALFYESLGHLSSDDRERVRRSRFVPGGDLVLEGSLRLLSSAALVLGVGAELAFGRTDVYVHGARVTVVPPLRFVGSLGFRHYF